MVSSIAVVCSSVENVVGRTVVFLEVLDFLVVVFSGEIELVNFPVALVCTTVDAVVILTELVENSVFNEVVGFSVDVVVTGGAEKSSHTYILLIKFEFENLF